MAIHLLFLAGHEVDFSPFHLRNCFKSKSLEEAFLKIVLLEKEARTQMLQDHEALVSQEHWLCQSQELCFDQLLQLITSQWLSWQLLLQALCQDLTLLRFQQAIYYEDQLISSA